MPPRKPKSGDKAMLSEFGIPNLSSLSLEDDIGTDDDENDLDSELEAILSGHVSQKPERKQKKELNIIDIEKIADECIKDINVDDEESSSADEELMEELDALTKDAEESACDTNVHNTGVISKVPVASPAPVTLLLNERLNLYREAQAAAKLHSDTSKLRRYSRAIKTLENQIKRANSGEFINEEDIPPVVNIPKAKEVPPEEVSRTAEVTPTISPKSPLVPARTREGSKTEQQEILPKSQVTNPELIIRKNQYKIAALRAKQAGDTETALLYMKIAKQIEAVNDAAKSGSPVDLTQMPQPPPRYSDEQKSGEKQKSSQTTSSVPLRLQAVDNKAGGDACQSEIEKAALEAANEPIDPSLFSAPPAPSSILEALEQRLEKYRSTKDAAAAEGLKSKVRRLQRIVQQYEDAIKSYNAGKPVNFEELPTPPGFAPIPVDASEPSNDSECKGPEIETPDPVETPPKVMRPIPSHPRHPKNVQDSSKEHPAQRSSSFLDKQLQLLLERQKLFRQAALKSKREGDIEQAKEYLRMTKGFDAMIEATRSGLPVDMTTVPPPPPQKDAGYYVIKSAQDMFENLAEENTNDMYSILEKELKKQIELCAKYRDQFSAVEDKASAERFQNLEHELKKKLISINYYKWNNEPVPKFHYETRVFTITMLHADLQDNELEVTIGRGINLPGKPESVDCYVKIELPIPNDVPQHAKTHTVYNTNNPVFQEVFKFSINRKSRSQLRIFKRHSLKCEVWSKGGFFSRDTLLGTASVKLAALETKCQIDDSFDLMLGRKPSSGKLEVKIRVRHPLLKNHVEELHDKWLVFPND